MSIVHNQKECRKQARQSGVAAMARNILTPGYCETPVMARVREPLMVARDAANGLTVRVKQQGGQWCTVFQLHKGSIKKYHAVIPGVDWLCLLKDWSNETSLESNFTCDTGC